ncbi:MAG: glycosyltransferase family 2 protein [Lachnospiraceae bacterium]|nr:glycosyltransferase family 2 protein [Lachnospiraceae bacterium]
MIKTSVIIPNYNGCAYLRDCLTFLMRCKGTEFHTIVVDDASTDDSCRMVREEFPGVTLLRLSENGGFAHAVNVGIRAARTDYVLLLNNDTVPEPDFVTEMEKTLSSGIRLFSVSAKMLSMKDTEVIDDCGDLYTALGWAVARGKGEDRIRFSRRDLVFAACGGAAIYRKKLLEHLGGFDEAHFAYLEDIDVGYRARIYGYRNAYCPTAVVYHAGSATSGSRYNTFKVSLSSRNSIYLIAKNMPPLQILFNLPFLLLGFLVKTAFFICKGFGGTYVKGLGRGFSLAFSEEGRKKRVRFTWKHLPNYLVIEKELLANMLALCLKIR